MNTKLQLFDRNDISAVVFTPGGDLHYFTVYFNQGAVLAFILGDENNDIVTWISTTFSLGYLHKKDNYIPRYWIGCSSVAVIEYNYSDYTRCETLTFYLKQGTTIKIDRSPDTQEYFDRWCSSYNIKTIRDGETRG